jgi:hypothetical protein
MLRMESNAELYLLQHSPSIPDKHLKV